MTITRWKRAAVVLTAIVAAAFGLALSGQAKTPEEEVLQKNKETVKAFYETAFTRHKPEEAVDKYVGGSYRQHNPNAADGSLAFIDFVRDAARKNPGLHVVIKRMIAEGNLVVTHVNIKTSKEDRGLAAIDIFRLENGRIVEHWDVVQPVPEKSANTNTMF
jgi:predicted SnoaL-like aldol condensation-catalyzing enzyme